MKLSLSRKPEADAWSIEDLLEKVRAGQIRLPEFQRLLKWTADDVLELFDSIIRGFPVGTLLFWKRAGARATDGRALMAAPIPHAEPTDLLWVLDGQQRLTSLTGVLLASGDIEDERFRIAFDLENDELKKVRPRERWPETALPLSHVLDSVDLMTWLSAKRVDPKAQRRALEIGKAIREYRVPAYIVRADDEDTARLIFDRTNATGKSLTKADVFRALHEGIASQEPDSIEGLQKSVEDLGFGPLRENVLLQAAAAVAGLDVTALDHEALSNPNLGKALPDTAAALRTAIAFLENDAHIPNTALLPYAFPVVALTRFFYLHVSVNARSRELLSRWVWRGALTQKHWTHEQKYLRETLEAIIGANQEHEIQRLLALLPKQPVHLVPGKYNLKSAQTRLELLALLDLQPRDLATGAPLDGARLVADEGSAAVQLLDDRASGNLDEDAARATVFGRIIQPPMGRQRLLGLLGGIWADDDVLASLGLVRDEVDSVRLEKTEPFAMNRMKRLSAHVDAFFERRARWAESDRPSLEALRVEDEE